MENLVAVAIALILGIVLSIAVPLPRGTDRHSDAGRLASRSAAVEILKVPSAIPLSPGPSSPETSEQAEEPHTPHHGLDVSSPFAGVFMQSSTPTTTATLTGAVRIFRVPGGAGVLQPAATFVVPTRGATPTA